MHLVTSHFLSCTSAKSRLRVTSNIPGNWQHAYHLVSMDDPSLHKARKGTRSCTECRRRKIRCIPSSTDPETCRRCEERGSTCIAQKYSSQPRRTHKLPSRQRISQLEAQVASLSQTIRGIEVKLGHTPTENLEPIAEQTPESEPSSDDSDDDNSFSEALVSEPSHLRSLFQNDWLTADLHPNDDHSQERKAKATSHILVVAKQELQRRIPSRDSVLDIPESAFKWLIFIDSLFPHKLAAKTKIEILTAYEDMLKPDVDPFGLALWLLNIAITAQQVPDEDRSPSTKNREYKRWIEFSHELSETVERFILSHDRLVGTIQGLGLALHYFRLHMSLGNFQKAWIRLRHYVVIAELVGLPKTQTAELRGGFQDERQLARAHLWGSICAVDRLVGMIVNLSPGTGRYGRETGPLLIEGTVQPWEYLSRLTDIAARIQQLDETGTIKGFDEECCKTALALAQELKNLASQTPESWWVTDPAQVKPDDIIQLLHYSILMRAYLPFSTHQNLGSEYASIHRLGMAACESIVQRYQYLRRVLPPGFPLAHVLDLQAFTASIVLLLTVHNSVDRGSLNNDESRIAIEVAQVVNAMDEKSREMTGSGFARIGAAAISSLATFLKQKSDTGKLQDLVLKVPLLGKVHVRRNNIARPAPQTAGSRSTIGQDTTGDGFRGQSAEFGLSAYNQPMTIHDSSPIGQESWSLHPLSWSIEDNQETFFQDTLMTENFDPFDYWENVNSGSGF